MLQQRSSMTEMTISKEVLDVLLNSVERQKDKLCNKVLIKC